MLMYFNFTTADLIFLRSQIVEQMNCSLNSSDIRETQSEKTSEQMSRQNAVRQCRQSKNIYDCCDEVQI